MMPKPTLFLTFLLSFVLLFTSSVQAAGCRLGGLLCGEIHNQTPWTVLYTTNPSPNDNCKSCCFFWNWGLLNPHNQQTSCTHIPLAPNKNAGGSGVDVDGFTYADREYYWGGIKIKRGQWTKFTSIQTVYCVDQKGAPHCG